MPKKPSFLPQKTLKITAFLLFLMKNVQKSTFSAIKKHQKTAFYPNIVPRMVH